MLASTIAGIYTNLVTMCRDIYTYKLGNNVEPPLFVSRCCKRGQSFEPESVSCAQSCRIRRSLPVPAAALTELPISGWEEEEAVVLKALSHPHIYRHKSFELQRLLLRKWVSSMLMHRLDMQKAPATPGKGSWVE